MGNVFPGAFSDGGVVHAAEIRRRVGIGGMVGRGDDVKDVDGGFGGVGDDEPIVGVGVIGQYDHRFFLLAFFSWFCFLL